MRRNIVYGHTENTISTKEGKVVYVTYEVLVVPKRHTEV